MSTASGQGTPEGQEPARTDIPTVEVDAVSVRFGAIKALSEVPTAIICGTDDKLTSIGHSRKLHAHIAGSTLLECDGALGAAALFFAAPVGGAACAGAGGGDAPIM